MSRWSGGVQIATPDYESAWAPYRDIIERAFLPVRYPVGDPRNLNRVAVMADALHSAAVK